jgi:Domain of unknown function (DUF3479)
MSKYQAVIAACALLGAINNGDAFISRVPAIASKKTTPALMHSSKLFRMAVTDSPTKVESEMGMMGGGMFTNSSPETKRVIPANTDGKTKFKIVYVVLESQYQSALTKACNKINEGKQGVAVEAVGYLLEELRNPANLEAFKADVASANIFIGSLIFVQELADKVRRKCVIRQRLFYIFIIYLFFYFLTNYIHRNCLWL